MRHRVKGRKLNRTQGHYRATMANLAGALIEHKQIKTTVAKAKELRPYIEKLITHAKTDNVHKRRIVYKKLNKRDYVYELFHVIGPAYADRNGGYTRILKLGKRTGDGADMAIIQLVGFEPFAQTVEKKAKKSVAKKEDKPIVEVEESAPKKKSTKKKAEEPVAEAETATEEKAEAETPEEEKTEESKGAATEQETENKAEESSEENNDSKDDEKK